MGRNIFLQHFPSRPLCSPFPPPFHKGPAQSPISPTPLPLLRRAFVPPPLTEQSSTRSDALHVHVIRAFCVAVCLEGDTLILTL